MPFKLKISGVEYSDSEIAISGKVVEGAFGGPEGIMIVGSDGSPQTVAITHHSMVGPEGWPVLPQHDTVVTLFISPLGDGVRVDQSEPVIGQGTVFINENRVDISSELSNPAFLAMQLSVNLESDSVEEPSETYFGISVAETERCYETVLESRYGQNAWPYIALPLDASRSVELEYAASIQFQDRVWICRDDECVLLGYNSGHFSLPALRFGEILWINSRLSGSPAQAAATLLLMSTCYLDTPEGRPRELARESFLELPGANPNMADSFADTYLDNLTVPGLQWRLDGELGWVNNWTYSQRNPGGYMSILDGEAFEFISEFFG